MVSQSGLSEISCSSFVRWRMYDERLVYKIYMSEVEGCRVRESKGIYWGEDPGRSQKDGAC